jgi:competence protein ComEA
VRSSHPEQLLVLLESAAVIVGAGALVAARRPPAPIRIFEAPVSTEVVVQVDGAVLHPGLYRLAPGARAADAIASAGGASADADLTLLNQARLLRDGERIIVSRRTSRPPAVSAVDPGAAAPGTVDLNAAGVDALDDLPGIGPVLARRIVAHRERHGPFHRFEDLLQVEGIGPRLLDRLRLHVVIR